jgi:hypothetical protein
LKAEGTISEPFKKFYEELTARTCSYPKRQGEWEMYISTIKLLFSSYALFLLTEIVTITNLSDITSKVSTIAMIINLKASPHKISQEDFQRIVNCSKQT